MSWVTGEDKLAAEAVLRWTHLHGADAARHQLFGCDVDILVNAMALQRLGAI